MATTTFRSEVSEGTGFSESITWAMIAKSTGVALYGPVVLSDESVTALPTCDSTTSAGDAKVIGVCVALPTNGTITAGTSFVQVCIHGRCKVKVNDADVALNDPLETFTTAGEAQIQPSTEISTTYDKADEVEALNNIRASFAIALTSVSSGANSYVACFVNIVPGVRVTAE